jgi:TRAP-type C4-dicarboxylate transport system permease large subunit
VDPDHHLVRSEFSMKRFGKVRGALSYANVVATAAIFVALGGSSYAALMVTSKDVRDNSLRSRDIRNNTLTSRDVRDGR